MELIADILLAAGAIGAGFYCFILGRRLKRFNSLEKGVGGAVAVLSAQVDDLNKSLASARQTAAESADTLTKLTERAEQMSKHLELQMAALHDVPTVEEPPAQEEIVPNSEPSQPMFMRHSESGRRQ
ncbi:MULTISPECIES: DUF6468 domain-containing protein [Rhodobacterales]|uniref:DUF6468 domain-containing protein n=1 Tax=Ascidiaceihabitans sp. TaxID=1872644 RepID=UPI0032980EFE